MLIVVGNAAPVTTTKRVLSTPEWENKITKYIQQTQTKWQIDLWEWEALKPNKQKMTFQKPKTN